MQEEIKPRSFFLPTSSLQLKTNYFLQFGRLLSSTSTYSASITSPGFFSCAPPAPAEEPPPAPAPAAPACPAPCVVLYNSSAILSTERSTFSFPAPTPGTPPSLTAFFAS